LLLGLLAIATYQDFADAEKGVANEASSLAALYRDIGAYPEPNRTALQNELREYTRDVIDTSWSLQHRGFVPPEAEKPVAAFQLLLVHFQPQDKSEELLHEETLRQSTIYTPIEGRDFTASPPASRPCCGTRSRSEPSSISC
jgi:hypothetical protein